MARSGKSGIKDEGQYEALREQGASKEKAARIANTPRREAGKKGGHRPRYEDWDLKALYEQAQKIGIKGRSSMSKSELIKALRNH